MALGLAVAPGQREGCTHCGQVVAQAGYEASHLGRAALRQAHEASIEFPGPSAMHESEKFAGEAANLGDHGFDLAQRLHEPLMVDILGLFDGELAPSYELAERAPRRWAWHRAFRGRDPRRPALVSGL